MLLYVVQSAGSSPGRRGFFMAVNTRGEMTGSIGGGIMEHKFVEMAKAKLAKEGNELSIHLQVHEKSAAANQSGMICSGEQTIVMYRVKESDAGAINQIIACLEGNEQGFLHLSNGGIQFSTTAGKAHTPFTMDDVQHWHFTERLGYTNHLYIIGGGHCALALSKLMRSLDFFIHLVDDRQGLNTFEENKYAHEKRVVANYHEVGNMVVPGQNTYVVVMTMGYRSDDIAIRALAGKIFGYLGVLGSAKKMEKMLLDYRNEGMDEDWLLRISAPAGLPIKSQTPAEIAVSIAGEIIEIKNRNSK